MIYVTGPGNVAWALDGRTGRQIWTTSDNSPRCRTLLQAASIAGSRSSGTPFMATIDAHLVALDTRTGNVDVGLNRRARTGLHATVAPLIVKNKVIVGIGGADEGARGFIDAYNINNGRNSGGSGPSPSRANRATPGPADAWRRGGGSTWLTGASDPELNLLYWGTGDPVA